MVLRFRDFNHGRFSNKILENEYMLFILDKDKNEMYPFADILVNENYLSNRDINEEELTFRIDDSDFYLSFDENRFVPMVCFSEFTENPFHLVRTMKFDTDFMNKHFRLALNCVQKKLADMYIYDVEANDPRRDLTSYYATSYVFDYNPRIFNNLCVDVTDEIKEFVDIVPKNKVQIQEWFKSINSPGVYCVAVLEDKKVIINITLIYSESERALQFKFEVEEDGISTESVWTTICENDSKIFIRTCEAMGDFLETEYGIIGAEMDISELMYLQTRDN